MSDAPSSPQVEALARQAHALAMQGQPAASRQAWERVLALAPGHPLALNYLGQEALARGDVSAARDMLGRAVTSDPRFALAHANLARVHRHDGDLQAALKSLDSALKWEPHAFVAHFEKADIYEQLGEPKNAALSYENALKAIPTGFNPPPALRERIARAQRLSLENRQQLASFLQDRIADARRAVDSRALRRFDESLSIVAGGKPFYQPRPLMFPFPGLPAIAFFDREDFPWAAGVESASSAVLRELESVLDEDRGGFQPYVQTAEGEPAGQFAGLDGSMQWGAYFLWHHGRAIESHIARCPETVAALAQAPQVRIQGRAPASFFSALQPHTHIPAHTGATNCRLTVHLPLLIPDGCALRVGNHVRNWKFGELLLFDDTMEHEAWNNSDQLRVVLIFDIWHPLLSETERELVKTSIEGILAYYGENAPLGEL
jgi:aspartyl/asparaginyl beta-hydroxylase (cupin superfamily)